MNLKWLHTVLQRLAWVLAVLWLPAFAAQPLGTPLPTVVLHTEAQSHHLTAAAFLELQPQENGSPHTPSPQAANWSADTLALGFTSQTLTATVILVNPTHEHIKRVLVLEAPWLDRIDIELTTPNGESQTTHTGDTVPFDSRALPDRRPNALLQLAPGDNTLRVRARTADPFLFRMTLMSREGLAQEQVRDAWKHGALYAALLALLLFSPTLAGSLSDGVFSWYRLYLGGFLLAHAADNGYLFQWLWPNWPAWANWVHALFIGGWTLIALLFAKRFLNLKERAPGWHRAFDRLAGISFGVFVLVGLFKGYPGALMVSMALCAVVPAVLLVTGGVLFAKGHQETRYFLFAITCGAIGTVLTAATVLGWLPYTEWGFHAADIGILVDASLLSMALTERVTAVTLSFKSVNAIRLEQASHHAENLEHQVDERTKAYQAVNTDLQAALETLQQRDRLRTRFFAAASHDLRQPLHAVRLLVEALQRTPEATLGSAHAQALDAATTQLSQLVESLLDISRLDAGAVTPKSTKLPLEQVANELESTLAPVAQTKHLKLRYVYPWQPLTLWIDRQLFMSVVLNLVGNAIKYTENGGVLVGFRKRNDGLLLQIWDTGCGFHQADKARIFEEFQQLNNPTHDRSRGLGLGLSIAKRTCDLLGLTLDCRSQPGRGSVFEVNIPAQCVLTNDFEVSDRLPSEPLPAEADRWRGSTILVVDDDPMPLHALAQALGSYGVSVLVCNSANEAMNHPDLAQVDALVADENLQNGLSGSYLLDALVRAIGRELPGVVVTGNTDPAAVLKVSARGWPVLFKPVRALDVLQTLSSLHSANQRRFAK